MDAIVTCPVCVCTWALRRLQGCDVQSCELDEILQEQAETKGLKPQRPWQLLTDRSVRWQLVSVVITSSAMQLCGNDSVRGARQTGRGWVLSRICETDVDEATSDVQSEGRLEMWALSADCVLPGVRYTSHYWCMLTSSLCYKVELCNPSLLSWLKVAGKRWLNTFCNSQLRLTWVWEWTGD